MASYKLSPKAKKDLEEIWLYTYKKWGEAQADKYVSEIDESFKDASQGLVGKSCDHILPEYHRYTIGKHVVYFRKIKTKIDIVRILHQKMNEDLHLPH